MEFSTYSCSGYAGDYMFLLDNPVKMLNN